MHGSTEHPEGKYAKVEMMGHRLLWGRISEVLIAGAPMLKVEAIVGGKIVGETMVNAASLYALTPCSAAQAFASAPKSAGYHDETLRLLTNGPAAGEPDRTADRYRPQRDYGDENADDREYNSEHPDHPDYDDEDQDVAIARAARDPDETGEVCEICREDLVNGVGCQRTDCPHPTPKDPNTPDMFSVAGAPPAQRHPIDEAPWCKVEDQPLPAGEVFELKRQGNVERDLKWENGCIFNVVTRAQLIILIKPTDEWRYQIDGEPEDLVQSIPPMPAPAETIVAIGTKVIVKGDYEAKEPDLHGVITRGPIDGMYEVECFLPNEDGGDTEMQLVAPERLQIKEMWQFWSHAQPPNRDQHSTTETVELRLGTKRCPGFIFSCAGKWLAAGGAQEWLVANGQAIAEDTVTVVEPVRGDIEWRIEDLS